MKTSLGDMEILMKRLRNTSTGVIGYCTPSPIESIGELRVLAEEAKLVGPIPQIQWDPVRGFMDANKAGKLWVETAENKRKGAPDFVLDLVWLAEKLPPNGVVYFTEANKFLTTPILPERAKIITALRHLAKHFSFNHRMVVLMDYELQIPIELVQDIIVITENMPDTKELAETLKGVYTDAKIKLPDDAVLLKQAAPFSGLHRSAAEQLASLAISPEGINSERAWTLRKGQLRSVKGLSFMESTETLDHLGGLKEIKELIRAIMDGRNPPKVIGFIEELDKTINSQEQGVGRDILAQWLDGMASNKWQGQIYFGPAGTGKSAMANAIPATYRDRGIIGVKIDINAVKGKYVGDTEAGVRRQIEQLRMMGGKNVIIISAANHLEEIPETLLNRFNWGIHFFDTPDMDERLAIWPIHLRDFGFLEPSMVKQIRDMKTPKEKMDALSFYIEDLVEQDLTGRDIYHICANSYSLKKTPKEGSKYIVPVAVQNPGAIKKAREYANNRLLSASYSGPYIMNSLLTEESERPKRAFNFSDEPDSNTNSSESPDN